MTGCSSCSESFCAITRPAMSVGPPGGNGRMKRMGFVGYACPELVEVACAYSVGDAANAASATSVQANAGSAFIDFLLTEHRRVVVLRGHRTPKFARAAL